MNIPRLAWKNVWRNRRRSLVTISAMSVALAALLVFSSLQAGMITALERNVVENETGDVQVFAPGYRDKSSIFIRIDDATLLDKLEAEGFKASARVRASGLAAGDKSSAGAQLIGIDVARDREVSRVFAAADHWLDEPRGVVIGAKLAKTLSLSEGDDILLLATASDGSMANEVYKVRGIVRGAGEMIDRAGVFMHAATLRDLMALPSGAHQLLVRKPAGMTLDAARQAVLDLAPKLDVQSWRDLLPMVAAMVDNQRASNLLLSLIIFTAVGIVILNAMMMAVFERIRELGVLKAIGMRPLTVFVLVMTEGAVQTAVALSAGAALAAPFIWYLANNGVDIATLAGVSVQGINFSSRWMAEPSAAVLAKPVIVLATVSFLAALFPALRAARLEPIDAIHHQ